MSTIMTMKTTIEVSTFNLGNQGRFVLPIAVRRAAHIEDGATMVARADGNGRVVIETREAISLRVWAGAPTPTGAQTVDLVRNMRTEDNETTETNFARRTQNSSNDSGGSAGALLLRHLGL